MKVLATFPGRAGDIFWALPSIRALAETYEEKIDLCVAGEFASLIPLLHAGASYLGKVWADPDWQLVPPDDWKRTVYEDPCAYDDVFLLGYRGWPQQPLAQEVYTLTTQLAKGRIERRRTLAPLDLNRPWLTVTSPGAPVDIVVGFTEAWFELKLGVLLCVEEALHPGPTFLQLTPMGSRWVEEVPPGTVSVQACTWLEAACAIRNSDLFFGDCSALHVLARALGKPVVLCEPMESRHNDIFYPYGKAGKGVELVLGNDGKPTFDARHCADAIRKALQCQD